MKHITQKELIDLIKDQQENAKNMFYETRDSEKDFGKAPLKKARYLAEMDTYQDLICYLNSVKIVPEHNDEIDALQYVVEGLKDIKANTDTKLVESLRNDRFREFKEEDGDITYIDGKVINAIVVEKGDKGLIKIVGDCETYWFNKGEVDYKDLVEWWKYWKQN